MTKTNPTHLAHCRCGAVEVGAWAKPIVVSACYCDDCQAAAEQIAASATSAPAAEHGRRHGIHGVPPGPHRLHAGRGQP